jgi:hypothetical protein
MRQSTPQEPVTRCEICGCPITGTRITRRYCSNRCRQKSLRERDTLWTSIGKQIDRRDKQRRTLGEPGYLFAVLDRAEAALAQAQEELADAWANDSRTKNDASTLNRATRRIGNARYELRKIKGWTPKSG